jgi:hypothetical protein
MRYFTIAIEQSKYVDAKKDSPIGESKLRLSLLYVLVTSTIEEFSKYGWTPSWFFLKER